MVAKIAAFSGAIVLLLVARLPFQLGNEPALRLREPARSSPSASPSPRPPAKWHFADHVIYLNLEKRVDRRARMEKEVLPGFDAKEVLRVEAVEHEKGYLGCTLSHIAALKLALLHNWTSLLVLEDDLTWNEFDRGYKTLELLSSRPYDVILLGAAGLKYEKLTFKLLEAQTTTAYLVHGRYFRTLLENFESGYQSLAAGGSYKTFALDRHWRILHARDLWYIVVPCLVYQVPDFSDIEQKRIEYGNQCVEA